MVRFGVIGTNFITEWVLAGAILDSRFELAAIYSRTLERAEEFAARYSIKHTFTSLEQMAASDLIDAVYIASPNLLHADQAMLFMNHGKHVLVEKALASNSLKAKDMIECSKKNSVALMEAMKPTLTPHFRQIMSNLPKIGKITKYFSSYCQYSSRYDKYKLGVIENAFKPELSNGATTDIGVYTIYPMVALFGKPLEIKAIGCQLSTGVDASASVVFKYADMDAAVVYSKISDGSLPTQIMGEQGTITADRINIISTVQLDYRDKQKHGENLTITNQKNEYFYEIEEFINVIESGKLESSINSHAVSLAVVEVMDQIREQIGVIIV